MENTRQTVDALIWRAKRGNLEAVQELRRIASSAIPLLMDAIRQLRSEPSDDWKEILRCLEEMPKDELLSPLLSALYDADPLVKRTAVLVFAEKRESRAVNALLGLVNYPDSKLRSEMAYALGEIGDVKALSVLEYMAEVDDGIGWRSSVRREARESIMKIRQRNRLPHRGFRS